MSLSNEISKLRELHESGDLTDEEFAQAKAKLLRSENMAVERSEDEPLQSHLEGIRKQNEVAQLDREWQMEREQYLVRSKYGRASVPSQGGSIVGAIVIIVFGVFWMMMASSITSHSRSPSSPYSSRVWLDGTPMPSGYSLPGMIEPHSERGNSSGGNTSPGAGIFPLFGLLFIVAGVIGAVVSFNKAGQYQESHDRYQRRREELLRQSDGRSVSSYRE